MNPRIFKNFRRVHQTVRLRDGKFEGFLRNGIGGGGTVTVSFSYFSVTESLYAPITQ